MALSLLARASSAPLGQSQGRTATNSHISYQSLGNGSQGNPMRPIRVRDYEGLLGPVKSYWEDLAPLV